jgi:hypothetical protein
VSAEFATFGVAPSATELSWGRWPLASMSVPDLDTRLIDYFKRPVVPPNEWFDGYETPAVSGPNKALNLLGHSYRSNKVQQLDIFYRKPVNLPIPVAYGYLYITRKLRGIKADDLAAYEAQLRDFATELN